MMAMLGFLGVVLITLSRETMLRATGRTSVFRQLYNVRGYATGTSPSALVFIEHRDGHVVPAAHHAITAAKKLGGSATGLILAKDESSAKNVIDAVKKMGLSKVIVKTSDAFEHYVAEPIAPMLAKFIKDGSFTHVAAAHTALGKNLFPRVSGLLDVQQISDVMAIKEPDTFVRPIYAGNAIATVKTSDPIKMFTVRAASWEAAQPGSDEASVEVSAASDVADSNVKWVNEELTKSERPELGSAPCVVSGGRGLKSKENFDQLIFPLADSLGAAVGASRAAVDSGYADNSQQVGQTGKIVAPTTYIAVGISGAIQHLAGMKDSKTIVSINKDPDAPIFQVADYSLVGDLFEAVPELTKKIEDAKK